MRPGEVLGEQTGRQAVVGIVGAPHHLGLRVERQHGHHRAEDLLLDDLHLVGAAVEDGRLHEEPVLEPLHGRAPPADHEVGAGLDT